MVPATDPSNHDDYWQRYGTTKTTDRGEGGTREERGREGANQAEIYVKTPRDAVVGFCGTCAGTGAGGHGTQRNETTTSLLFSLFLLSFL